VAAKIPMASSPGKDQAAKSLSRRQSVRGSLCGGAVNGNIRGVILNILFQAV
jgi:hypothetical protein